MPEKGIGSKKELESLIRGYRESCVIGAGVEMGAFDALVDGPRSAESVACRIRANRRGSDILLDALAALGLLVKKGGKYSLSKVAAKHLVTGAPESISSMVRHAMNVHRSWVELSYSVKWGKPVSRPAGAEGRQDPRRHRDFILAMHDSSRGHAEDLAAWLDLSRVKRVLDVGGGPGSFLFAMVRRNPSIQGAVFDLPETLEITREMIAAENMSRAVGTIEGDFNHDSFGAGYDLILMSSIVHINSFAENKKMVKKAFRALNPGSCLIVRDHMLEDSMTEPLDGALFSVNMLVNTERGRTFSKNEIKSWYSDAGFVKIQYKYFSPRSVIMIGAKPEKAAKKK